MPVVPRLSELELFLLTVENDAEESPWMVMADLQVPAIDLNSFYCPWPGKAAAHA